MTKEEIDDAVQCGCEYCEYCKETLISPDYVLGCLCGECVTARGSIALQEADREKLQQRTLEKLAQGAQKRAERIAALHPHTNCPRCKEEKEEQDPKPGDPELEALIDCMRTSAQDTLANLRKQGWKIIKA